MDQHLDSTNSMVKETGHAIFRQKRAELGYSQIQVANLCKMSVRQYRRYESGENSIYSASFQVGVRLCHYLNIDMNDLFTFESAEES